MKTRAFFLCCLGLLHFASSAAASYPIPCLAPPPTSSTSPMCDWRVQGSYNLKYFTNFDLRTLNESITLAVIAVHGRRNTRSEDPPYDYYEHIILAAQDRGQQNSTLVIAPYFSRDTLEFYDSASGAWIWRDNPRCSGNPSFDGISSDGRLCWRAWDGNAANDYNNGGNAANDPDFPWTSSFAIMDDIIAWLAESGNFPNLETIIVTGQSAGGQYTLRYAMVGAAEPDGITMRYIPANPGGVTYLDGWRPDRSALDAFPNILYREDCNGNGAIEPGEVSAPPSPSADTGTLFPDLQAWADQTCALSEPVGFEWLGDACHADGSYDLWPWGLSDVDSANDYLSANCESRTAARARYIDRNVVLLTSIEDNEYTAPDFPCEPSSVDSCEQAAQGYTRLERNAFFFNHVCIYNCSKHGFASVAADRDGDGDLDPIGHGGHWMYRSEATRSILFDGVKPPSISGQNASIPAVPGRETLLTLEHLKPGGFAEGTGITVLPGDDYIYRYPAIEDRASVKPDEDIQEEPLVPYTGTDRSSVYIRPDEDVRGDLLVPVRVVSPIPNAPLHRYFTSNQYMVRLTVPGIVPDISVNGREGPLTLSQSGSMSLSVSLECGEWARGADWWLAAETPFGIFFLAPSGWTSDLVPAFRRPLFDGNWVFFEAVPLRDFPPGTYVFFFGVDTIMNGVIDADALYFDAVTVHVTG